MVIMNKELEKAVKEEIDYKYNILDKIKKWQDEDK